MRTIQEIAEELARVATQLEGLLSVRSNLELQLADVNDQVNAAVIRVADLKAEIAGA